MYHTISYTKLFTAFCMRPFPSCFEVTTIPHWTSTALRVALFDSWELSWSFEEMWTRKQSGLSHKTASAGICSPQNVILFPLIKLYCNYINIYWLKFLRALLKRFYISFKFRYNKHFPVLATLFSTSIHLKVNIYEVAVKESGSIRRNQGPPEDHEII